MPPLETPNQKPEQRDDGDQRQQQRAKVEQGGSGDTNRANETGFRGQRNRNARGMGRIAEVDSPLALRRDGQRTDRDIEFGSLERADDLFDGIERDQLVAPSLDLRHPLPQGDRTAAEAAVGLP